MGNAGMGMRKGDTYLLLMAVQLGAAIMAISAPQKAENRSTTWSNCITLGHVTKGFHILL